MRRKHVLPLVTLVVLAFAALGLTVGMGKSPELGLDLQGGASVVLQAKGNPTPGQMDLAIAKIRNRIDGLGVAEPEVSRQGNNIVVSLPGVKDQDRALDIVSQTGELRFRPVIQLLGPDATQAVTDISALLATTSTSLVTVGDPATETTVSGGDTITTDSTLASPTSAVTVSGGAGSSLRPKQTESTTTTAATTTTTVATTTTTVAGDTTTTTTSAVPLPTTILETTEVENDDPNQTVVLPQRDPETNEVIARYQLGPAFLTGDGIETADFEFANSQGWGVTLELKDGALGIDPWNAAALQCFNGDVSCPSRAIAIVLDGVVVSAPQIQPGESSFRPFSRDQISISGNFEQQEAEDLATVLKDGALPIALEPQAVQTVSATLGKDSLRAGVVAGLVGVALVVLFMLFYYRMFAVVVVLGLCVSAAIMWTVISWRGAVLTLAGAAGIIVSIGVTIDSYVVYFERLKDNIQGGRSVKSATTRGFKDAWRTILAADSVSLLAAAILYWQTVGAVRGFAFYLGLSTVIDMVIAYFFTQNAVALLASSRFANGKKVLGVEVTGPTSVRGATV